MPSDVRSTNCGTQPKAEACRTCDRPARTHVESPAVSHRYSQPNRPAIHSIDSRLAAVFLESSFFLQAARREMRPKDQKANSWDPRSTHVYLSISPRKKRLRLVPFSRITSARSTRSTSLTTQRSALAACEILGLVEALGGKASECPCVLPFIPSEQAVRIVLHDPNSVAGCDRENRTHLAGNSRIVNHDDCLGSRRYEGFQATLIKIQRIGTNVREYQTCSAQSEGIRRRDKVNDGTITSSSGPQSIRSAAISSACVQEVVSKTRATPSSLSRSS